VTMPKPKLLCVIGTRPEAIKLAPVVFAIRRAGWASLIVVSTGQHRELLQQTLDSLGLRADIRLDAMRRGQSLTELLTGLLAQVTPVLSAEKPDLVLIQGDTSSAFATALACVYSGVPTAHVEAGLRTRDLCHPFPEEMHRQLIAGVTQLHFAPTRSACAALRREGISRQRIFVTGNTCIDMLHQVLAAEDEMPGDPTAAAERVIVVTLHRRETLARNAPRALRAIGALARHNIDIQIIFLMHPNPVARRFVERALGGCPRIVLREPLDYRSFVRLLKRCYLVITDSGGIQEEAAALGKPVFVLREKTERHEAVTAGVSCLCGTDYATILRTVQPLLDDAELYQQAAKVYNGFGDGRAAERINRILKRHLLRGQIPREASRVKQ
jgi:UDP-N-acetylglucosamine 2-epimerase (non-hydrolysing)